MLATRMRMASFGINRDGLQLWLKADAISGLSDGDSVAIWRDSSMRGNDATQEISEGRPQYKTNILNRRPVVRFNGSNDRLVLSDGALDIARNISNLIVFLVRKQLVSDSTEIILSFSTGLNATYARANIGFDATSVIVAGRPRDSDSYQSLSFTSSDNNVWRAQTFIFDYANAKVEVLINGVTLGNQDFQSAGNTSDTTSLAARVGAQVNDTFYFNGDIAELIVYNKSLAISERESIEAYLMTKYGL